jgi:hydrogenase/urease accessory protein HupE
LNSTRITTELYQAEFGRGQCTSGRARQAVITLWKVVSDKSVHSQLDENNNVEVLLNFDAVVFLSLEIQSKIIAALPFGHRQYLQVQNSTGETLLERLLSAAADRATVEMSDSHSSTGAFEAARSFANFLCLGVKHILTGYDHLLFLLGLLLVARGFFSSLGIITAFTIAHSITLAVATLHLVQIPSRIVEPLIAASIVFVGIENLLRGDIPTARRVVAFGFGLIHGFGFASAFEAASADTGTAAAILLQPGVELGQIMVAAVALPIIWKPDQPSVYRALGVGVFSGRCLLGSFGSQIESDELIASRRFCARVTAAQKCLKTAKADKRNDLFQRPQRATPLWRHQLPTH